MREAEFVEFCVEFKFEDMVAFESIPYVLFAKFIIEGMLALKASEVLFTCVLLVL